jgi:hypothetical protein
MAALLDHERAGGRAPRSLLHIFRLRHRNLQLSWIIYPAAPAEMQSERGTLAVLMLVVDSPVWHNAHRKLWPYTHMHAGNAGKVRP